MIGSVFESKEWKEQRGTPSTTVFEAASSTVVLFVPDCCRGQRQSHQMVSSWRFWDWFRPGKPSAFSGAPD
jgi:hypothetical protein